MKTVICPALDELSTVWKKISSGLSWLWLEITNCNRNTALQTMGFEFERLPVREGITKS